MTLCIGGQDVKSVQNSVKLMAWKTADPTFLQGYHQITVLADQLPGHEDIKHFDCYTNFFFSRIPSTLQPSSIVSSPPWTFHSPA